MIWFTNELDLKMNLNGCGEMVVGTLCNTSCLFWCEMSHTCFMIRYEMSILAV